MKILVLFFLLMSFLLGQENDGSEMSLELTNVIAFQSTNTNTNLSPLEFYRQSTEENFVRRTEAIFFISIPFTYLFTNILFTLAPYPAQFSAYFNGIRGVQLRVGNFSYSRDRKPLFQEVSDPYYVFLWSSTTIWPATIAVNSFVERFIDPNFYENFKTKIISNRPSLERIFQSRF